MSQKKMVNCNDITLLQQLSKEIRKFQGVNASNGLYGLESNFLDKIDINSLDIIINPNITLIKGKTTDYDFEIHKFENIIKIVKYSKYSDINIIRFVDEDSNVRINSTITNYKISNNPLSKAKDIRGNGNATLLCDHEGNFIYEEQFWQTYEDMNGNQSFKPHVRHELLQAIDNGFVLGKNHIYYLNEIKQPKIKYRKYVIHKVSDDKKVFNCCAELNEDQYYELLEDFNLSKIEEIVQPKLKSKKRIFNHKD